MGRKFEAESCDEIFLTFINLPKVSYGKKLYGIDPRMAEKRMSWKKVFILFASTFTLLISHHKKDFFAIFSVKRTERCRHVKIRSNI